MDYGKAIVVRDKDHNCTYLTLGNRIVCITDDCRIGEVDRLPKLDPENTPLRDKHVFQLQPYPYTGMDIPPRPVELLMDKLLSEVGEQKSA
jgi:hypothetical protein